MLTQYFPIRWNVSCVPLKLQSMKLWGMRLQQAPEGIVLDFEAVLALDSPEKCAVAN